MCLFILLNDKLNDKNIDKTFLKSFFYMLCSLSEFETLQIKEIMIKLCEQIFIDDINFLEKCIDLAIKQKNSSLLHLFCLFEKEKILILILNKLSENTIQLTKKFDHKLIILLILENKVSEHFKHLYQTFLKTELDDKMHIT